MKSISHPVQLEEPDMADAVFYVFFLYGLLIIFVMTLALVISLSVWLKGAGLPAAMPKVGK